MLVTAQQVKQISLNYGRNDICEMVAKTITEVGDKYFLDTPIRIKHFLGQCCIESTFFTKLEENLNYSAKRMTEVWPNRFPTLDSAATYANNPIALANKTYGGRMGNTAPNSGWNYRGSSLKQITGFDNFDAFNKWIHTLFPNAPDFVKNPDFLRTLEWSVWPGIWYWVSNKCYLFADKDDVKGLTRAINGGLTGYEERVKATAVAGKIFNMKTNPAPTPAPPKTPDPLLMEYQNKMLKLSVAAKQPSWNPGKPDGWMGTNTKKAVESLQSYCKLLVDGKPGPNTRKAIDMLCEKYKV